MGAKIQEGDVIRMIEELRTGATAEHLCVVQDVLSTQVRATYEWRRPDGGWHERSLWAFLGDIEWDIHKSEWIGTAS